MNKKITTKVQAGFTLVELSIVIVIIGFLVAGIAAGANLVKQAQLRSVISDINSYQTAYNGFINAYNGVPGDITTASSFWSTSGTCSASVTVANCDGDGDGNIEAGSTSTGPGRDEILPALKELQLAGFISAGITTVADGAVTALTPGVSAPQSKITGAGYMITSGSTLGVLNRVVTAGSITPIITTKNVLYLGKPSSTASALLSGGSLLPQEAFNLDQKVDDGGINGSTFSGNATGNFRTVGGQGAGATACLTAGANYNIALANPGTDCLIGWRLN